MEQRRLEETLGRAEGAHSAMEMMRLKATNKTLNSKLKRAEDRGREERERLRAEVEEAREAAATSQAALAKAAEEARTFKSEACPVPHNRSDS